MDQFTAAHVGPLLQPGEPIQWMACIGRPARFNILGVPERYDYYLAVGTDRRLIAVEAVVDMFSLTLRGKIRPQAGKEVHVWWYAELYELREAGVEGLTSGRRFDFEPLVQCGPLQGQARRYDIFPGMDGFDAQNRLGAPYLQWVAQGVASRSFPVDPSHRARLDALLQETHVRRQQQIAAIAAARAAPSPLWNIAGGLLWVALLLGSVYAIYQGRHDAEFWGKIVARNEEARAYQEETLEAMEAGELPPAKCEIDHEIEFRCVCVDEEAAKAPNSTNKKRKLVKKLGLYCFDVAGLTSEMAGSEKYDREQLGYYERGKTMRLFGGIGIGLAFASGVIFVVLKSRKK